MRFGVRVCALAAALAAGSTRGSATAEPERTSSFSWVRLPGAESCLGPRALAEAIERRLQRRVFVSAAQADVAVEGWVERRTDSFHAVVRLVDAEGRLLGTRDIEEEGASCGALDGDLALSIALMIDPAAAFSAPPPKPPEPPRLAFVPPPPFILQQPMAAPVAAPAPKVPWRASLEVGPALSLGLLPGLGGGLAARVLVTPPHFFALELGGTVYLPKDATNGATGASFTLANGLISGCPLAGVALGVRLFTCLGVEVGAMQFGGFGFPIAQSSVRPIVNVAARGRASRHLAGPLLVSAGVALLVPILRDTFFFVDEMGVEREVFRPSPVGAAVDLSLGIEFP